MGKMKNSGIEWIGNIPEEWEIKKIKYITKIPITDGPHETPVFVNEGVPFYSVDGIQNEKIVYEPCRYISVEDANRFDKKIIPSYGDILMGKAASIGKIAIIDKYIRMQVWSPLAIIRVNEKIMNNVFLKYYLLSNSAQTEIDLKSTSNTQKNIAMEDIENITIPFFDIKEQKVIADFLDDKVGKIDDILNDLNKQVEILEKYKKTLITETVTKGLNSNVEMKNCKITWIERIPVTWKPYKVKYSIKLLTDYDANGSFETIAKNVFPNTGKPYAWMVRATDLENNNYGISEVTNYCDEKTYKFLSKSNLKSGDLLMAKRGGIGNVYILPELLSPATLAPNTYLLRFDNDTNTKFMYYLFKSDFGVEQLKLINKSTTIGAIYKEDVKSIEYAKPPIEEQEKIADYLDEKCNQIDEIIKDKQNQIDKMEKYKKSLIYEYVTGKKRVKGAEELYV